MKLKISFKQGIRVRWGVEYNNYPSCKFLQYKTLSLQFTSRFRYWFKNGGYGTWQWAYFSLVFAWIGLYYSHDYVCHVKGERGPILVKSETEGCDV
ncbi:hypothetical protein KAR91_30790 [Candidatus Pacearchaeota archaeon]|nr:hypothetical protein [Candidatus Pacearchaeota archaeon]